MKYTVNFSKPAEKQLESIPKSEVKKIIKRAERLASEPFPKGCEKLKGSDFDIYRVRQGDYRILYRVFEERLFILVIKIGHRSDVYRVIH